MEIHKPKPVHNWREFLKEYAIIVWASPPLSPQNRRSNTCTGSTASPMPARRLLELRDDDAPQAYTRIAAADCFERQLTPLRDAIEAGRPRAEIMTMVDNYRPNIRTWDMTAWTPCSAPTWQRIFRRNNRSSGPCPISWCPGLPA